MSFEFKNTEELQKLSNLVGEAENELLKLEMPSPAEYENPVSIDVRRAILEKLVEMRKTAFDAAAMDYALKMDRKPYVVAPGSTAYAMKPGEITYTDLHGKPLQS